MKVRMFPALSVEQQATVANGRTCSGTPGTAVDVPNFDALGRDPLQNVRHRRRFPFPTARRGDAAPLQSGGDRGGEPSGRGP